VDFTLRILCETKQSWYLRFIVIVIKIIKTWNLGLSSKIGGIF